MADIERRCGNCHHFDLYDPEGVPYGIKNVVIDEAGTVRECYIGVCRVNLGLLLSCLDDITECRQPTFFTPSVQASITGGIIFSSNKLVDVSDRSL